jgi:hypothetical protein
MLRKLARLFLHFKGIPFASTALLYFPVIAFASGFASHRLADVVFGVMKRQLHRVART